MAEYLSPDIFIEEIESNKQSIERTSTSVAAFIGKAERGPVNEATLITSFGQYKSIFGGYLSDAYLTYAVDGFFKKIKGSCYIVRAAGSGYDAAEVTIKDNAAAAGDRIDLMKITASSPGVWGEEITVTIEYTSGATVFDMTIATKSQSEKFSKLSMDPDNSRYFVSIINNSLDIVHATDCGADGINKTKMPLAGTVSLDGGSDGDAVDAAGYVAGLSAFDNTDVISIIACPETMGLAVSVTPGEEYDEYVTIHEGLANYAELRQDVFAILDPVPGMDAAEFSEYVEDTAKLNNKYAAIYYPNIVVFDPLTSSRKTIPPSGQIAGIYAKTDVVRGVHKAPAGVEDGQLVDVLGLETTLNKSQCNILYPARVNPIISKRGVGYVVWGNRTLSSMSDWRSINVRRLFINLLESLAEGTEWAVFKPNTSELWGDLRTSVTVFLKEYWREGAFFDGGTGNWRDAFYVKCDSSNNDGGEKVIIEVGIAPTKAAEFVVFRVSQWDGGRLVDEIGGN